MHEDGEIYSGKASKRLWKVVLIVTRFLKYLYLLHSWRWRMKTLLTYFSNRLAESVLKWNANSLKNVTTNIFMLIIVIFFFVFISLYFSPFCAHVNARLFPTEEARVVLPCGQILCFEMQGNIFMCFVHAKWMILKLSTSGTHLRSDMAHNAKTHTYCWAWSLACFTIGELNLMPNLFLFFCLWLLWLLFRLL